MGFGHGHGHGVGKPSPGAGGGPVAPGALSNYVVGFSAESFTTPADHAQATSMAGTGNLAPGGPAISALSSYPMIHQTTITGSTMPDSQTVIPKPGTQNWLSNNWWTMGAGPYFHVQTMTVAAGISRTSSWSGVVISMDGYYSGVQTSYRGVARESGWGFFDYNMHESQANFFRTNNGQQIDADMAPWTNKVWHMMAFTIESGAGSLWYDGASLSLDNNPTADIFGCTQLLYGASADYHVGCIHLWDTRHADGDMLAVQAKLAADFGITI